MWRQTAITIWSGMPLFWPRWAHATAAGMAGAEAGYLLRLVTGLVLVIGAIILFAWLLRRLHAGRFGMQGPVRVLGGVSVGQRERVVLVEAGGQQLLLGVAPGQVRTLQIFDRPVVEHRDNADTREDDAVGFYQALMSTVGKRR